MGSLSTNPYITSIAHINLTVPPGTLSQAHAFYSTTLGLTPRPVPALQKDSLAWFDIGSSGQQIHIAHGKASDFEALEEGKGEKLSSRHPCFKVGSPEGLVELRRKVYEHFERGGEGAPREADKPGDRDSGEFHLLNTSRLRAKGVQG
jgi:hypothetical protein